MEALAQQVLPWILVPTAIYGVSFLLSEAIGKDSWVGLVRGLSLLINTIVGAGLFAGLFFSGYIRIMPSTEFTMQYQGVFLFFLPLIICWTLEVITWDHD